MIRIAITGAAGRMGRTLVQALDEVDALTLGAAFERPGLSLLGADAGELAGVRRLDVPVTASIKDAIAIGSIARRLQRARRRRSTRSPSVARPANRW